MLMQRRRKGAGAAPGKCAGILSEFLKFVGNGAKQRESERKRFNTSLGKSHPATACTLWRRIANTATLHYGTPQ